MVRIGPYKITGSGRCWFIRRVHENGAESPIGFRQRKRDAAAWYRREMEQHERDPCPPMDYAKEGIEVVVTREKIQQTFTKKF